MRTIETTVYKFSELLQDAKDNAIEVWRENGLDYDWWDCSIDQYQEVLKMVGFISPKVYFSLGYSQSDYCAIKGRYEYQKGALSKVKEEFPQWVDLHRFVKELQDIQKRFMYKLSVKFDNHRSGHSSVSDCYHKDHDYYVKGLEDAEKAFKEAVYSFEQDIYYSLRNEYEYLISDDVIAEILEINDYEFTENGEMI